MAQDPSTPRDPLGYMIIDRLTQPQFLLAIVSAGMLGWLTHQLIDGMVPDSMREVIATLVGFISGQMVGPGWQFYFGNTKASDEKTRALSDNAATMRKAGLPVGSDTAVVARMDVAADQVDVISKED